MLKARAMVVIVIYGLLALASGAAGLCWYRSMSTEDFVRTEGAAYSGNAAYNRSWALRSARGEFIVWTQQVGPLLPPYNARSHRVNVWQHGATSEQSSPSTNVPSRPSISFVGLTAGHYRIPVYSPLTFSPYARDQARAKALPPMFQTGRFVIVPYWLVVLLTGAAPMYFAARRAFRWRRGHARLRRGQCLACGYDLRGSASVCPECGVLVPAPQAFMAR